ncbi:uncharacterized protein B0I36DRAFT_123792 [Microdochium trichocladiopsis]|uniref:F-box domain-containing protein n=1 Tax=Microdochium trichocladiopsis TaxID=1682393 RepID=A0A9P8Y7F1_9PEZI|nr:uncharacterized protein B0I36DRAFT_123792 [Microdochium trichocladiopsis]KAH7031525.1 hypothetical protein B0I36DRAFT_123792 [Microdochium trichocladiopsis]
MQRLDASSIGQLPTEILIHILAHFPTRQLLSLATLSRRFYDLVGRLHYSRLLEASRLDDHVMVLECYHPSVKISTPTLYCEYLGTDGIQEAGKGVHLASLHSLYSRFRPSGSADTGRGPPPIAGRNIYGGPSDSTGLAHDLFLDSGELFSQLCTQASIIKVDPSRGLFLSISSITEGVIRVWRKWLQIQSRVSDLAASSPTRQGLEKGGSKPSPVGESPAGSTGHSVILWTDVLTENVGLKFRVVEKTIENPPLLVGPNDEPPVAYTLQYEELLVRTNALLLSLERSLAQQVTHAGKAVVIASM